MTVSEVEILLVEDNAADAELTLHALRQENLANRVQVARDGEEALDFLFCRGAYHDRRPDQPPQLVLLDLKLPKVDGLEVLRQVKSDPRTRAIPVVVLTSSQAEEDLLKSYQWGTNSFVHKPVSFDRFQQALRTVALYWLVVNQAPAPGAFRAS